MATSLTKMTRIPSSCNNKWRSGNVYSIHMYMNCSDGYQNHHIHKFTGSKEECTLLITLFKKFDKIMQLHNIKEESFIFESKIKFKNKNQRIFFKLCRYVRTRTLKKILVKMVDLIDNGVKPYNAILLAHYSSGGSSIRNSMDVVPVNNRLNHFYTYRSWNQFIDKLNTNGYINNLFKPVSKNKLTISTIKLMVSKSEKYAELQRNLLIPRIK